MSRDAASTRQVQAAQPHTSTWLSANAGSGKTRVLTDRVARLLLSGVSPEHILCLTYTKAAASEMQNRLFKRLGEWAMLSDTDLAAQLAQLEDAPHSAPEYLSRARTLFARAIETPGGLRIQTIHSFCAALLRRFPLEAQVSPQFTEMEDRAASLMRADIVEALASGPQAPVIANVALHFSGDTLDDLSMEVARHRARFETEFTPTDIRSIFGISDTDTPESVLSEVFLGGEVELIQSILPALKASGVSDQKAANTLAQITAPSENAQKLMEQVFLFGATAAAPFGAKIGKFPTKGLQNGALAEFMPQLDSLMLRVEDARGKRLAIAAAEKTIALHGFAQIFLPAYSAEKQRRGWLDFDDLIFKARQLLNDSTVAAWVLYRLDGGIDHILVDEAQDTSPVQWQVIERLAQEFTSGMGARSDVIRTIFVVGDKKQSIYSFQGADPDEFDRMKDDFAARLKKTDAPLQDLTLEYSFRSAEAILRLVDMTFEGRDAAGFDADSKHLAFKDNMPGRVDLWPLVEKVSDDDDDQVWYTPQDRPGTQHHRVILAQRVAKFIKTTLDSAAPIPIEIGHSGQYESRPAQAGDFLILVQSRSPLFHEIIRACKQAELPIAGADRLKVGAELAVRDLGALLSFLATPEDNLSLATALRSPLFGITEQQLFDLAHRRTGPYLWSALRDRTDMPTVLEILHDLRAQTDFLRPFDLIERILTRHNGRKHLLSRLGDEAEEGINALLSQALAYEQNDIPSLTGFLQWMQTDDLEIKRQMDSSGNRIRVMTVHGAKGLEAPIVILPDTAQRTLQLRDEVLTGADAPIWKTSADTSPPITSAALESLKDAQTRERDRLLYVAMTRAEKWLVVAAAGDLGNKGEAWYDRISAGLETVGAADHGFDYGEYGAGNGLRYQTGNWDGLQLREVPKAHIAEAELDPLFTQPVIDIPTPPETLKPSDLGGAKALPGEPMDSDQDEDAAKRRGRRIHLLLEYLPQLPQPEWETAAETLLNQSEDVTEFPPDVTALFAEARNVLTTPALAEIFAPNARVEVPVTANLDALKGRRIHGIIDRLIVTDTHVTAIDFKSNRKVPDSPKSCPKGLLRQMGAYLHALQQVFPDHTIGCGLLWTHTATYMDLPHDLVTIALQETTLS